ncbi:MAG: DUF3179 domain-containing (seleno)protein [Planctomycetota bacterium]
MTTSEIPANNTDAAQSKPTTLDFKGGGWVVVLALGLAAIVCVVQMIKIPDQLRWRDGQPPPPALSNSFDLHTATVPVGLIAVYRPKDAMQVMVDPSLLDREGMAEANKSNFTKYIVADDRVIGVTINGEARAYPLRVLTYHEVANDTLGGVPILVSYCPISGSAVVFDRRVGDKTLQFGMSGLIYNSNILLYDIQDDEPLESLWSQMTATPIQGVAAGKPSLKPLPSRVMFWQDWQDAHPDTTVIAGDPRLMKQYRSDPFLTYPTHDGTSKFPVRPLMPRDDGHTKDVFLIVRADGEEATFPSSQVEQNVDPGGTWRTTVGDTPVTIHFRKGRTLPHVLWAEADDPAKPLGSSQIAYRFVWYAHANAENVQASGQKPG